MHVTRVIIQVRYMKIDYMLEYTELNRIIYDSEKFDIQSWCNKQSWSKTQLLNETWSIS